MDYQTTCQFLRGSWNQNLDTFGSNLNISAKFIRFHGSNLNRNQPAFIWFSTFDDLVIAKSVIHCGSKFLSVRSLWPPVCSKWCIFSYVSSESFWNRTFWISFVHQRGIGGNPWARLKLSTVPPMVKRTQNLTENISLAPRFWAQVHKSEWNFRKNSKNQLFERKNTLRWRFPELFMPFILSGWVQHFQEDIFRVYTIRTVDFCDFFVSFFF